MGKELIYANPEQEGIGAELIIDYLNEAEKAGAELHGILIIKNGKVVFEAYNEPYHKEIPHITHSFTKCLTNTAVGVAYSNGLIGLKDKVLYYLPEYQKGANDYLRELTIEDLLLMRSGQERSVGGDDWRMLESSWLDNYFQVPFVKQPGTEFKYSSGNSYILSAIVQRITGQNCYEYIQENVAGRIGMDDFTWMKSPEGICSGGNGVNLKTEDMARIGMLYLNFGKWDGQEILSEEWVLRSLGMSQTGKRDDNGYNYHWKQNDKIWVAGGMFGQACILVPVLNMVVAITAADDKDVFVRLLQEKIILPLLSSKKQKKGYMNVLENKKKRMTLLDRVTSVKDHIYIAPACYHFKALENTDKIMDICLKFMGDYVVFGVKDHRGYHEVEMGMERWVSGRTSMTGGYLHHQYEYDNTEIVACAFWEKKDVLRMEWRYPQMAFYDHISIRWKGKEIEVKRWTNMNSHDTERPVIYAVKIGEK